MNDNETSQEVVERVKRQAEGIYLDMTAQGDPRLETMKRTSTYQAGKIAQLAGLVMELADALRPQEAPTAADPDTLEARAEYHRENAAQLFSDKLFYYPGTQRWHERGTDRPVVFTPYGWIIDPDL